MKNILIILVTISILIPGCGKRSPGTEYNSYGRTSDIMGTFMVIKVKDNRLPGRKIELIIDRAFQLASVLESKLSIYDPESEINRLNESRVLNVSQDLFNVLKASYETGVKTGGEYDITVSPILKQDGFYSDMSAGIFDKIPASTSGIGWDNIKIYENHEVRLINDNTWVDLSGIAKGYIVDSVAEFLINEGLQYFLINAGGDIFCGNKDDPSIGWLVGIREPNGNSVLKVLSLRNMAIATSGDYENIVIDDNSGKVMTHLIDPKSKTALLEQPSSITVIAPTCTEADAFATGMMIMGAERSIALADKLDNIEVITSRKHEGSDKIQFSKGAESFVMENS